MNLSAVSALRSLVPGIRQGRGTRRVSKEVKRTVLPQALKPGFIWWNLKRGGRSRARARLHNSGHELDRSTNLLASAR